MNMQYTDSFNELFISSFPQADTDVMGLLPDM